MSTLIGLVTPERSYIGFDSQGTAGNRIKARFNNKAFKKVSKDGASTALIGVCGSYRLMQILQYQVEMPVISSERDMVKEFIPALKLALDEHGYEMGESERIIVVANKWIFEIEEDFQVGTPHEVFYSIGSGSRYASGAMEILLEIPHISMEEKLIKAINVSKKYDACTGGDFKLISTKN